MRTMKTEFLGKTFAIIVFIFVGAYMLMAQITTHHLKYVAAAQKLPSFFLPIAALLTIGAGTYLLSKRKHTPAKKEFLTTKTIVLILLAASILPRVYLILNTSIVQTSDYNTYWITALSLANENRISEPWQQYFGAIASNMPFMCSFFALGLKLFGPYLNVLLGMNILFYTVSVLALFSIGSHFMRKKYIFCGALLYALWPNTILGSLYLASEPIYICFLLSGFAILLYGLKHRGKRLWFAAAMAGIILSMSQGLRPLTTVLIIALLILLLAYYTPIRDLVGDSSRKSAVPNHTPLSFSKRLAFLGLMFLTYLGTNQLISMYNQSYLPVISKPNFGWTLYEGNNPYAYGQWAKETSEALYEVSATHDLQDVQPTLLKMALEQLQAYDLKGYAYLIARKSAALIGNSNYYYHDINQYRANGLVEHGDYPRFIEAWSYGENYLYKILAYYLIYLCLRSVYGLLKNQPAFYSLLIFTLPYAGICALHSLVTSIPRYGYPTIPILILACFFYHDLVFRSARPAIRDPE